MSIYKNTLPTFFTFSRSNASISICLNFIFMIQICWHNMQNETELVIKYTDILIFNTYFSSSAVHNATLNRTVPKNEGEQIRVKNQCKVNYVGEIWGKNTRHEVIKKQVKWEFSFCDVLSQLVKNCKNIDENPLV